MLNRPQKSVNISVTCTEKPKTSFDLPCCYLCLIAMVWNRTHNIAETGLRSIPRFCGAFNINYSLCACARVLVCG